MKNNTNMAQIEMHGTWRTIPSPAMTEIIAQSDFSFQILDREHGAYDFQTLENDIRACNLHKCAAYVRVSGLNQVEVQRSLDLGADGIVFPQLVKFDDFEKATRLVRYAPEGLRGFNPFVRAWGYGFTDGNKTKPLCITIVETLKAVEDLDNILTLKGIDMVYIGSYDLSAQLGCIGEMGNPKVVAIIDQIIQKCVKASVAVGLMIAGIDQYKQYKSKGVSAFVHTVDSHQLKKVFTNAITELKQ
jgi:2-keto-3-deoxy-L-rhamnonate aldolase RhmA